MKKDELLGLLDKLDELSGLIAVTHSHLSPTWDEKDHKAYAEIKRILNLHFSISEEERKEAVEWIGIWLPIIGKSVDNEWNEKRDRIFGIILKALGENNEKG